MGCRKLEWKRFVFRDTTSNMEWCDRLFYFWDETFIKRITIQRVANRSLSKT